MGNYAAEHDACGIGTIVNIDGHQDHQVLDDAMKIVERLDHRAGRDASGKVGDGVGILMQISHRFFAKVGFDLGNAGEYGIGMFFMPREESLCLRAIEDFDRIAAEQGMWIIGWRKVPVNADVLGERAKDSMPDIRQVFVAKPDDCAPGIDFDRKLYILRRSFEKVNQDTYVCSLSSRTITYKGMFLVNQLRSFYPDLQSLDYETAIAIVHSRFSTNTVPSWNRAHPYRFIAHNGEINTIRGNKAKMLARQECMQSDTIPDLSSVYPVISPSGSDSAMLDNSLEFLYYNGMDLPLAMMTMIPEAWSGSDTVPAEKRDFYQYYETMMEPWDGPAAVIFTDGVLLGATLDRNGLRPARYYVTDEGQLILASEVGVFDIDPAHIVQKSRLRPGRMLLVDTKAKRIITDAELKERYAKAQPYRQWLNENMKTLADLPAAPVKAEKSDVRVLSSFGYTYEDVKDLVLPMALNGIEPTMSMGHDVPLAGLCQDVQPLFHYFHQQFAQVTNPPIDSIREKMVTDTSMYLGCKGNLLKPDAGNCRLLKLSDPVLSEADMARIRQGAEPGIHTAIISTLYQQNVSLEEALKQLCDECDQAIADGAAILVLSDRGMNKEELAIPVVLAIGAVETHLEKTEKLEVVSLVAESGEVHSVHQCAVLLGLGASAVNPYLAHACIRSLVQEKEIWLSEEKALANYDQALLNGVVKTASKMGISVLQSYQAACIFTVVGLSKELMDYCFLDVTGVYGSVGLKEIDTGIRKKHALAYAGEAVLASPGYHKLRSHAGAYDHLFSPEVLITLQKAVRDGSYEEYCAYTDLLHQKGAHTLRDELDFVKVNPSVPLAEVEPVEAIMRRFKSGAMSYGALSKEAHECIAEAMNSIHGKSNTGEGGEDAERFGTKYNSAIKQVASGRFGVTAAYLLSANEIQIKMAQGAKPGEGGNLPGKKVYPWVAKTRFSTPGVTLISPPPHHDIYSIEDLAQLIYDLKNANPGAAINVKLASEDGVGTIACGVAKAGAQVIALSGFDGGTGAAPYSSIHHAGLPWEIGLVQSQHALIENDLRSRVKLEVDGKLMSGRDVVMAALLGADEYSFASAVLVSLGCMMLRACSKDTCAFGIATQNEQLRSCFKGKPEYVVNFMRFTAEQVREEMAALGFRTMDEMIGRSDCLKVKDDAAIDLLQYVSPEDAKAEIRHHVDGVEYDFHLDQTLDEKVLIPSLQDAIVEGKPGTVETKVSSVNRTVGTLLGTKITGKYGNSLADDTYVVRCTGGGGQSFGAFLPKGLTVRLTGDANDYVGKGLSGGRIVVVPPENLACDPHTNILIGNVALYGATSGTAYFAGVTGERFCVRNSGAVAVAEGCGDHGLEYMTGGRAVLLGKVGRNFAAGMSGGIAYVLDEDCSFLKQVNPVMVSVRRIENDVNHRRELKAILSDYVQETGSLYGRRVLDNFSEAVGKFWMVLPKDYEKMMLAIASYEEQGLVHEKAVMQAFQAMRKGE